MRINRGTKQRLSPKKKIALCMYGWEKFFFDPSWWMTVWVDCNFIAIDILASCTEGEKKDHHQEKHNDFSWLGKLVLQHEKLGSNTILNYVQRR